MAITYK